VFIETLTVQAGPQAAWKCPAVNSRTQLTLAEAGADENSLTWLSRSAYASL